MARLTYIRGGWLISVISIVLMVGCAVRPLQTGPLPTGVTITSLNRLNGDGPIAWHPSGTLLATGTDGLSLFDLTTGTHRELIPESPSALIWTPEGQQLAVAWHQGESTRLELREQDGKLIAETLLPGHTDRLLWSNSAGLLLITTRLKLYSFGADLSLHLHRWDGHNEPTTKMLHNNTIKPSTAKGWLQGRFTGSQATLSSSGDEMLYLRLHDPPAFSGSYRLHLRHLDSDAEKEIASLPLTTRSTQFIDDERALVDIGNKEITEIFIWSKDQTEEHSYTGGPIAISPGGRYWLVGGELLREGEAYIHLPELEQAFFSPSGSSLLLKSDGDWHLLKGLSDEAQTDIDDVAVKKLRQLRNWRSRGLISPEEFLDQQQRILHP